MSRIDRRKKASLATGRLIRSSVRGNPVKHRIYSYQISHSLDSSGIKVSVRTVRRLLVESGLDSRLSRIKPYLRKPNIHKRLEWARTHLYWTMKEWENYYGRMKRYFILSNLNLVRNESFNWRDFTPRLCSEDGDVWSWKVMVWGCFSSTGLTACSSAWKMD